MPEITSLLGQQAELRCGFCDARISRAVVALSRDGATVAITPGMPVSRPGTAFYSLVPLEKTSNPETTKLRFSPQLWFNPLDVEDCTELTKDKELLKGCCGISGTRGPNVECANCGNLVGTLKDDCWTPHIFIPQPGCVTLKALES